MEGQRLKALYLKKILLRETDENHSLTATELSEKLNAMGVDAERKSIYASIAALSDSGELDIAEESGKGGGFRVLSREFELAELKMLVDAVQSSRFISKRQCSKLIGKISSYASVYEEKELSRSIYIYDREEDNIKNIYYNIDCLHRAISENSSVYFQYIEITPSKKYVRRHGGEKYHVSPFALIWQDEKYYLVAYDHKSSEIRHYRVDKMEKIEITEEKREGKDKFAEVSLSKYHSTVFEMFRGEEYLVHFRCDNRLAGAVFDRFGTNIPTELYDGYFEFYAPVEISARFYGWVFGFEGGLTILSPENVAAGYRKQLEKVEKTLTVN